MVKLKHSSVLIHWASEVKAKLHLVWLTNTKIMRNRLQFRKSHDWNFEHDAEGKKCCYNQRQRKLRRRLEAEVGTFRMRKNATTDDVPDNSDSKTDARIIKNTIFEVDSVIDSVFEIKVEDCG